MKNYRCKNCRKKYNRKNSLEEIARPPFNPMEGTRWYPERNECFTCWVYRRREKSLIHTCNTCNDRYNDQGDCAAGIDGFAMMFPRCQWKPHRNECLLCHLSRLYGDQMGPTNYFPSDEHAKAMSQQDQQELVEIPF